MEERRHHRRRQDDFPDLQPAQYDPRAESPVEMSDPWKHRATSMRCKTCMWFVPKAPEKKVNTFPFMSEQPYDLGRCRRHAPTMNGYPTVFVNDWCGDHKLDENKI